MTAGDCIDCRKPVEGRSKRCIDCKRAKQAASSLAWQQRNRLTHAAQARERRKLNPEKAREASRKSMAKRRSENPEGVRWAKIKSTYGLTRDEYDALVRSTNGECPLCGRAFDDSRATLRMCIDHDHKTGKVRGAICGGCNTALGYVRDDIERLRSFLTYLDRSAIN